MAQTTVIADQAITDAILNERTFGWDVAYPSTWAVNGFFLRTDLSKLYQNTGTEGTPVWTLRLQAGTIATDETGKGVYHDGTTASSLGALVKNALSTTWINTAQVTLTPDVSTNWIVLSGSASLISQANGLVGNVKIVRSGVDKVSSASVTCSTANRGYIGHIVGVITNEPASANVYDLQVNRDGSTNLLYLVASSIQGAVFKLS